MRISDWSSDVCLPIWSSGGQPRHELNARLGYVNNGLGARLSVDWESGTHVDGALGGTTGGASRLDFGSLATADLRLFANLGQMPSLVKKHPFLRGARISIGIDNLFNQRRSVTDADGKIGRASCRERVCRYV